MSKHINPATRGPAAAQVHGGEQHPWVLGWRNRVTVTRQGKPVLRRSALCLCPRCVLVSSWPRLQLAPQLGVQCRCACYFTESCQGTGGTGQRTVSSETSGLQ